MTIRLFIDRLSLPCLRQSTFTLLFSSFFDRLFLPFISRLSYSFQIFIFVSRIYTYQRIGFVSLYLFLLVLLNSFISWPLHQNFLRMQTPPSKMQTFLFACTSCLDVWLEEMEADFCKPKSITTSVDWVVGKARAVGAATPLCVVVSDQLVVPGSIPDVYQAFGLHEMLKTKSNGGIF